MAQTLLQVCQQASREMGITAPATIIANTDLYAVQLLNLFNGIGQDLAREYDWQGLTREHSFSTEFYSYTGDSTLGSTSLTNMSSIASLGTTFMISGAGVPTDTFIDAAPAGTTVVMTREATSTGTTRTYTFGKVQYTLPSGFDRLVDDTQWDKTEAWPLIGPNTGQQWQWIKGSAVSPAIQTMFRVIRNLFQIYPLPTAENYLRFEYVSAFWGATSASAVPTLSTVTADTDTNVFPDRLMVESLKLRFRVDKGMAKERHTPRDIERGFPVVLLDIAKAADAGSPSLSMAPRRRSVLIGEDSIPDHGYGA